MSSMKAIKDDRHQPTVVLSAKVQSVRVLKYETATIWFEHGYNDVLLLLNDRDWSTAPKYRPPPHQALFLEGQRLVQNLPWHQRCR